MRSSVLTRCLVFYLTACLAFVPPETVVEIAAPVNSILQMDNIYKIKKITITTIYFLLVADKEIIKIK